MNITANGTFIMKDSYHGFVDASTKASLNSILSNAFQKGELVELSMTVKYLDTVPLCHKRTKYAECGEILNKDGSCPDEHTHVEVEEEVTV